MVFHWIYKPFICNIFSQISKSFFRDWKKWSVPAKALKVKHRTLKCIASPSCLVKLLLAVFWAVFTGFSCFLVTRRICSSVQIKEEPPAHSEERFYLFLALQTVTMVLKTFNNYWTRLNKFRDLPVASRIFAAKHSWKALHMSRPLFVGSYLQVTWWALLPMKRKKSLLRMII